MKLLIFAILIILNCFQVQAKPKQICNGGSPSDVGLRFLDSQIDGILDKEKLIRQENRRLSAAEKIKRVKERFIQKNGAIEVSGYNADRIAKAIVWAADCTGNDFQVFAAVIAHESSMCKFRKAFGEGIDSGCGQLTPPALNELKNQMQLPHKTKTGRIEAKEAYELTVQECYAVYPTSVNGSFNNYQRPSLRTFKDYFGRPNEDILNGLRSGDAVHADLLLAATHLKQCAVRMGGYTVPGTDPGGIACYNGKGVTNYYAKVKPEVNNINLNCVDDTYTPAVMESFCELGPKDQIQTCKDNLRNEIQNPTEPVNYDGKTGVEI